MAVLGRKRTLFHRIFFDCIHSFKVLYLRTSVKGGAHMRYVVASICEVRMSPALNGSSEIQRFERTDAIKICNGIIVFYPGLSHTYVSQHY